MWNNSVTMYWSVPLDIWWKEVLSLTWSASILETWSIKTLIDLWLFQGWEGADLFNKQNIEFLEDISAVIISHPHIDHVWRLPLLFKQGFRKPIYMTPASKDITRLMLEDSYMIQEWDKIERLRKNNKLWSRLKQALKIKQALLDIEINNFEDKEEKLIITNFLEKKLWKDYNIKEQLEELSEYLDFYKVETTEDIRAVIKELNENLFTKEDMYGVLDLINTLEYWEEKIVSSKKITTKNKNNKNQELLESLPEKIANWYNWEIFVESKSEKRILRSIWQKQHKKNISNVIKSNTNIEQDRKKLKKQLEIAWSYCYEQYWFLNDTTRCDLQNRKDYKTDKEYWTIRKIFKNHKKLLERHGIKMRADIVSLIKNDEVIIDTFKIKLPFSSNDIIKASHLLQIKNTNGWERNAIGLSLNDATHIVWSASINIISWIVKWKINNILDINGDATSYCFSGDLGRIEDNRLWKPELPSAPVDYLQIESTYWWKEHRNKQESIDDLIKSIQGTKSHVLISTFAQQRLQEVLITLLEAIEQNKNIFGDREILIDAPLWEKLTKLYTVYKWEVFNMLDPDIQIELFGKEVFRFLSQDEWKELYFLSEEEWEEEADKEKKERLLNQKYIILASSGMMEWWAIMNHLTQILPNPEAKILAPWYLCQWTIWNQIVIEWKEQVTIWWIKYDVNCESKFIDWFSSHISHSETLFFIEECIKDWKLKLKSTIALNHWNKEWQLKLQQDIKTLLEKYDRGDIKITIPELFSEYNIKTKRNSKKQSNIELYTESFVKTKPKVPKCLIKIDYSIKDEEVDKELENQRNKNLKSVQKTQKDCTISIWKINKSKKKLSKDFLSNTLKNYTGNPIFTITWKIKNLCDWQRKIFETIVDKKLSINKINKSQISSLTNKIKNINIIFDLVEKFKNDIDYTLPIECEKIIKEIDVIKIEILNLEKALNSTDKQDLKDWISKEIIIKKRKLRYLNEKLSQKELLISWNTSKLKEEKNILVEQLSKEGTKKSIVDKIKKLEKEIQKAESKRTNFANRLKKNIDSSFHENVDKVFFQLWNSSSESDLSRLKKLVDIIVTDLESNISILKSEIIPHISIWLNKRKPFYEWYDISENLFNESNKLNTEKLKELIKNWFFDEKDKQIILNLLDKNEKFNEIKNKSKKVWTTPIKKLNKFFKTKDQHNKNLWIDLDISIKDLNQQALEILSSIFNKKYFETNILPNFNIYLFLKSKESLFEYILRKYNLEQLNGYKQNFDYIDTIQEELEYSQDDLDNLESALNQAKTKESLVDLNYGIDILKLLIKEKVEKVSPLLK